jgi:hypothetical protein
MTKGGADVFDADLGEIPAERPSVPESLVPTGATCIDWRVAGQNRTTTLPKRVSLSKAANASLARTKGTTVSTIGRSWCNASARIICSNLDRGPTVIQG